MTEIKNENDCTIEEMVMEIKKGEVFYFEPLFMRFIPLVRKLNNLYDIRSLEEEDFYQESRIVLHRAIHSFDRERGLGFAGYYKLMLQHRIYSLIRKEGALKRVSDKSSISYDLITEKNYTHAKAFPFTGVKDIVTPENIIQVRESTSGYIDTLSALEKEVFYHFLRGEDFTVIAEKVDCSLAQVRHAYDRCRLKMKKMLQ
ncbi:RNA polymerase subunit sigma-70 [Jeotgalibaca sp. MA1X17-3]|uniref:sigma-70 family RNA polymerase sigma factor n=1 Tax=Jeotgalibaca sp. MA1X17-3 TaxID=2908211 RepID=UPI001F3884EB|nr:sigma-70 family RNA polymerase sigma factor [Jeotgalibaca sp. MA1X17-3]UJF15757.1 RNA polymerase subunit sigma-70 [Jeotgalibaca sp. MA1X17-3]